MGLERGEDFIFLAAAALVGFVFFDRTAFLPFAALGVLHQLLLL